jgi:hypothetical protein
MDAALHSDDWDFADGTEDKLASVADGGGLGEMRDFGVGDFGGVFEFVGEGTEAGAEDQGDFGAEISFGKNKMGGGFGLVEFGERFGLGWSFFSRRHWVIGILHGVAGKE